MWTWLVWLSPLILLFMSGCALALYVFVLMCRDERDKHRTVRQARERLKYTDTTEDMWG